MVQRVIEFLVGKNFSKFWLIQIILNECNMSTYK